MYLLFGVKYDVQNAKMFIKNKFILKKKYWFFLMMFTNPHYK